MKKQGMFILMGNRETDPLQKGKEPRDGDGGEEEGGVKKELRCVLCANSPGGK